MRLIARVESSCCDLRSSVCCVFEASGRRSRDRPSKQKPPFPTNTHTHANRAPRAAHPPARPTLGLELAAAHVWLQAPRKKPFAIHSCARYSCSADGGIGQLVSRALLLWTLLAAVISDPSAGDRALTMPSRGSRRCSAYSVNSTRRASYCKGQLGQCRSATIPCF